MAKPKKTIKPLDYRPTERGHRAKPAKIDYVRKMAADLVPVIVFHPDDCATFWRIFYRHCAEKKKTLKLYSRQIAEGSWLLIPQVASAAPPPRYLVKEVTFSRWGRYKVFAARLEAGETLHLNEEEAEKARTAWIRYHSNRRASDWECTVTHGKKKATLRIERK